MSPKVDSGHRMRGSPAVDEDCQLVRVLTLPAEVAAGIYRAARRRVEEDPAAELFAGERVVTPLPPTLPFLWCSAHLMVFGEGEQAWHRHFGERCLFIVAAGLSAVEVSPVGPDADLAAVRREAHPLAMDANGCYLFRMRANVWHRFRGEFCAVSFHPDDTRGVESPGPMGGHLSNPMGAFSAFPTAAR